MKPLDSRRAVIDGSGVVIVYDASDRVVDRIALDLESESLGSRLDLLESVFQALVLVQITRRHLHYQQLDQAAMTIRDLRSLLHRMAPMVLKNSETD